MIKLTDYRANSPKRPASESLLHTAAAIAASSCHSYYYCYAQPGRRGERDAYIVRSCIVFVLCVHVSSVHVLCMHVSCMHELFACVWFVRACVQISCVQGCNVRACIVSILCMCAWCIHLSCLRAGTRTFASTIRTHVSCTRVYHACIVLTSACIMYCAFLFTHPLKHTHTHLYMHMHIHTYTYLHTYVHT